MDFFALNVADDAHLQPCEPDEAIRSFADERKPCWLHVTEYDPDELADWLDRLELTDFVKRRILRTGRFTKVVSTSEALVIELRTLGQRAADAPRQLVILCIEGSIVTFDPISDPELRSRALQMPLVTSSTTSVLLNLLLVQLDRTSEEVHGARKRIFELDGMMDRSPLKVTLDQIHESKDRLLRILAVVEEQSECFQAVAANAEAPLDFSGLQGSRHLLVSGATSTERMAMRLEKRASDLKQRYDTYQQEKTNGRLAVLTIISAIFLPLGLLAGVWGMNFEYMPELRHPLAYPMALITMMTVAGSMILFFRRRGWFN